MTDLEQIRAWIATYPDFDILGQFQVDFTDTVPANGGIFPSGLVEVDREEDILGNVEVHNQYNFGLYYVFPKAPGDNASATVNADWVMDFQRWVQEQSVTKAAPTFGNIDEDTEAIRAQNGVLYDANEEGTATYMVQLSVNFTTYYEVNEIV
ncbi:MAG: hypothetical protein H6Q60_1160 [Oscillospiraceae bacterium]|nr:hypothetical protein [Oscillospiraceae bacterium]